MGKAQGRLPGRGVIDGVLKHGDEFGELRRGGAGGQEALGQKKQCHWVSEGRRTGVCQPPAEAEALSPGWGLLTARLHHLGGVVTIPAPGPTQVDSPGLRTPPPKLHWALHDEAPEPRPSPISALWWKAPIQRGGGH